MVISYRKISEQEYELDVSGSSCDEDERLLREVLRPLLRLRPGEKIRLTLNGALVESEVQLLDPPMSPSTLTTKVENVC